jgi:hypothetical protein
MDEVGKILTAANALNVAGRAVENLGDTTEALVAVREAAVLWEGVTTDTTEDFLTLQAMNHVLGNPVHRPTRPPVQKPWEDYLTETLAFAWLDWAASGKTSQPLIETTSRLKAEQKTREESTAQQDRVGGIHLMSLYYWLGALNQLGESRLPESRRLWKRALELGSTHGTASHIIVSWTYVATFLNEAG